MFHALFAIKYVHDLDALSAQRIMDFFILITHKAMRSQNPIAWHNFGKYVNSLEQEKKPDSCSENPSKVLL